MGFYLQWPVDTGDTATNTAGLHITGLSPVTPTNVAIEFATDMPAPTTQRYLFMEGGAGSDRIEQFAGGSVVQQGTSNYTLNGEVSAIEAFSTAVAGDVYAADYSAFTSELWIGSSKQSTTSLYDVGISKVTITDNAGVHVIDMNTSGGTGSVVNSDTGALTATLVNFPTDGSQWVSDGPFIAVTQSTLTPGGTISGTYADYTTIPTTLTVSDGTNTITIPTPTITDNGDGTGSFSGTMPALPTTGTASLVLFGDVTVELA